MSSKQAPSTTSAASPNSTTATWIKMKDLSAFKWMIINLFGHDYMHDFFKGDRAKKNKNILEQTNTLVKIISKYKKEKKGTIRDLFVDLDKTPSRGGGLAEVEESIKIRGNEIGPTGIGIDGKNALEQLEESIDAHILIANELYDKLVEEGTEEKSLLGDGGWFQSTVTIDDEKKKYAEYVYAITVEEKYFDELIVKDMPMYFRGLAELLVTDFFGDIIGDIIDTTTSTCKLLDKTYDDGTSRPILDEIIDEIPDTDTGIAEFVNILEGEAGGLLEEELANIKRGEVEVKSMFERFQPYTIDKKILGGKLKLKDGGKGLYSIKGKKLELIKKLKVLTDGDDDLLNDGAFDDLLNDGDWGIQSFSGNAEEKGHSSSDEGASSSDGSIIKQEIGDTGLAGFASKIIFRNIIREQKTQRSGISLYRFETPVDTTSSANSDKNLHCIIEDVAEQSVDDLFNIFNQIWNEELQTFTFQSAPLDDGYYIFGNNKKELHIIKDNAIYILNKCGGDKSMIKIVETLFAAANSKLDVNSFKAFWRFVLLNTHPDKIRNKEMETEACHSFYASITDAIQTMRDKPGMAGGGIIKGGTKKEKVDDEKVFKGLNTLLGKKIIENSLTLMNCVTGNRQYEYFPVITDGAKTIMWTDESDGVYGNFEESPQGKVVEQYGGRGRFAFFKNFLKKYIGIKPKFENIFAVGYVGGVGTAKAYLETLGAYSVDGNGKVVIDWGKICPTPTSINTYKEPNATPTDGAPLEFRKLIARNILLNIQVLILYQNCSPEEVGWDTLLNGLYLTLGKEKNTGDVMKNYYYSEPKNEKQKNTINNLIGCTGVEEIKVFIANNRTKWFGFMFDYDERKKISEKPTWLMGKMLYDDQLQISFNIVLKYLLPEFIYYMSPHDKFETPGRVIPTKKYGQLSKEGKIPTNSNGRYIINNAVGSISPVLSKINNTNKGFFHLTGTESKLVQYCPAPSIADAQPQCSVTALKTRKETYNRKHEYDLEMGIEAENAEGATYSYIIEMIKASDNNYFISAVLSRPGLTSIKIGDKTEKSDLTGKPLGLASTFIALLKTMNKEIKNYFNKTENMPKPRAASPREILQDFFAKNMGTITKRVVKKSVGDYGQEHVAAGLFGSGVPAEVLSDESGYENVLKYANDGNSLRFMLANDRPSAYRNIFMLLFSDENTVNSRAVAGYWNSNPSKDDSIKLGAKNGWKNTIIISPSTLLDGGIFNTDPRTDRDLGLITEVGDNILFKQENLRKKLRAAMAKGGVGSRIKKRRDVDKMKRTSNRGYGRWFKKQEVVKQFDFKNVDNYTKNVLLNDLRKLYDFHGNQLTITGPPVFSQGNNKWRTNIKQGGMKNRQRSKKRKRRRYKKKTKKKKKKKNKTRKIIKKKTKFYRKTKKN